MWTFNGRKFKARLLHITSEAYVKSAGGDMEYKWKNYKSYDVQKYGKRLEPADLPQVQLPACISDAKSIILKICLENGRAF